MKRKIMHTCGWIVSFFAAMCLLALMPIENGYADVIFIVNGSVKVNSLSRADIKEIFLGDRVSWDDGREIKFVTLKISETHKAFVKDYTKKSETQFLRFWKKQVFTGKGLMPKQFDSEKEVVEFVANTEGAIGYISSATPAAGASILKVTDQE